MGEAVLIVVSPDRVFAVPGIALSTFPFELLQLLPQPCELLTSSSPFHKRVDTEVR